MELVTNVRQCKDPIFQRVLNNIRNDETTNEDIEILEKRLEKNLDDNELSKFFSSTHIFASNFLADLWNKTLLLSQNIPIKLLSPILTPPCEICEQDYKFCYAGRGVQVSISRNLCQVQNKQIVNGTRAIVQDIYYSKKTDRLPKFVACTIIPKYKGPVLDNLTVPIPCLNEKAFCVHHKRSFRVKYIPIRNDNGLTAWRCQSKTMSSAVVTLDGFKFKDKGIYSSLSLDSLVIRSKDPIRKYFFRD